VQPVAVDVDVASLVPSVLRAASHVVDASSPVGPVLRSIASAASVVASVGIVAIAASVADDSSGDVDAHRRHQYAGKMKMGMRMEQSHECRWAWLQP